MQSKIKFQIFRCPIVSGTKQTRSTLNLMQTNVDLCKRTKGITPENLLSFSPIERYYFTCMRNPKKSTRQIKRFNLEPG